MDKVLYSGWYCPKCQKARFYIDKATQELIDNHMAEKHSESPQPVWAEEKFETQKCWCDGCKTFEVCLNKSEWKKTLLAHEKAITSTLKEKIEESIKKMEAMK